LEHNNLSNDIGNLRLKKCLRKAEVAGSIPVISIKKTCHQILAYLFMYIASSRLGAICERYRQYSGSLLEEKPAKRL